jgi:hypothetical protein
MLLLRCLNAVIPLLDMVVDGVAVALGGGVSIDVTVVVVHVHRVISGTLSRIFYLFPNDEDSKPSLVFLGYMAPASVAHPFSPLF